jgi:cullin 3
LNPSFKCKMKKLKLRTVNPMSRDPSYKNRLELEDQVLQERELQCDACIVRIMKSRKTLSHAHLVKSVIEQLAHRFQAQPQLIKKRIQILLDREFLARSPEDMYVMIDASSNDLIEIPTCMLRSCTFVG